MDIYIVDSFTDKPFTGNPAAVCVLKNNSIQDELMQKIAAEMNLSETAFVLPAVPGEDMSISSQFNLRWFTPKCEVNLCGHATLATSAIIFNSFNNPNQRLTFSTLSGDLLAVKVGGSSGDTGSDNITPRGSGGCRISLDLPLAETEPQTMEPITKLIQIVIGDLPLSDCRYSPKTKKLLLRMNDTVTRNQLESIKPDTVAMVAAHCGKIRGVIVTVKSHDSKYHFISRYFAPWVGIPEDPVTGSAHTVAGPYWAAILKETTLRARQCSPRGGDLTVTVRDSTVVVEGGAFIVMKGRLNIS